jgi:hypothetical protein
VSLGAFLIDFGGERTSERALLGWHFAALPPNVVSAVDLPHCSHDLAYSPKSHPPRSLAAKSSAPSAAAHVIARARRFLPLARTGRARLDCVALGLNLARIRNPLDKSAAVIVFRGTSADSVTTTRRLWQK